MTSTQPAPVGDLVLVVGAAHIDVIADYDERVEKRMDKAGLVRFSIGGTAYNIAVDLGQNGVPTALMTVLKQPSFSSVWVRERLESFGVRTDFVDVSEHVAESGFVALRCDGNLVSAVTSSAVEQHTFRRERIDQAVRRARIVVLDCNLGPEQLTAFAEAAQAAGRPVVVAAVSDTKVRRITDTSAAQPFDLVCLNELEARAAGIDPTTLLDASSAAASCALLHARSIVVTLGVHGHCVLTAAGGVASFPAPVIDAVVSASGAGDALLAGIVAHAFKHGLDPAGAQGVVTLLVRKVLGQSGATVGSLAVDADYARLAKIALREETWAKRYLTQEIGVAVAIVLGVVTLVFGAAQLWYAKRADDNAAQSSSQAASAAFSSASDALGKRAIAAAASASAPASAPVFAPASSASAARPASASRIGKP